MATQTTFGPEDLLAHIVGDIAEAVSHRPGEPQSLQVVRAQAAIHTIMDFRPDGAIEAMLAGHCLMFHEMIVDSVRATFRGEEPTARRASRANIVAMDKAFGDNLLRLERRRRAKASPETPMATETEIAERARRHQARTPPQQPAEAGPAAPDHGTILHWPSPDPLPGAPDPGWPAQGIAIDPPGEASAAAGRPSQDEFSDPRARQTEGAWRGNRQARRHPNR